MIKFYVVLNILALWKFWYFPISFLTTSLIFPVVKVRLFLFSGFIFCSTDKKVITFLIISEKKDCLHTQKTKTTEELERLILILLWCWHIKLFPDIIIYFERSTLLFPSSWNKYSRNQRDIILAKSSIHMRHCLYYLFSFLPIYLLSPK